MVMATAIVTDDDGNERWNRVHQSENKFEPRTTDEGGGWVSSKQRKGDTEEAESRSGEEMRRGEGQSTAIGARRWKGGAWRSRFSHRRL